MSTDVEARLREMLAERAATAVPVADAVEKVRARASATRLRRWAVPLVAAAAAVAVIAGSMVLNQSLRSAPVVPSVTPGPPPTAAECLQWQSSLLPPPPLRNALGLIPASAMLTAGEAGDAYTPKAIFAGTPRRAVVGGRVGGSAMTWAGNPQVLIGENAWRFSSVKAANADLAEWIKFERCKPQATRIHPNGETNTPNTAYYRQVSSFPPGFADNQYVLTSVVLTRVGNDVAFVYVNVSLYGKRHATAPTASDAFLVKLAEAVRAADRGNPQVPLPAVYTNP